MSESKNKKAATVSNKKDSKDSETQEQETSTESRVLEEAIEALKSQINSLEEKVKELEDENSSLKDQYLRKQADFENFRKRMQREKEDAIRYANSNLLLDIVTIIDDFERAIKAGADTQDLESFRKGIELIEKQFTSMLERKWGLTRFDSAGEEFNPDKHEAIATEETDHDTSIVIDDYQKGYMLHDRVLRPAKVRVSMPSSTPNSGDEQISEVKESEDNDGGEE